MTFFRVVGVLALAGIGLAGTASWRDAARRADMENMVSARRELAATRLAPVGAAPQAGVSARAPIRVQPFPRKLARRMHHDADFHRLSHRCGVCHETPDPALHTAAEWPAVVQTMSGTIAAAGLLPLSDEDRAAVLRVLTSLAAEKD
jgi:hypothetical protein